MCRGAGGRGKLAVRPRNGKIPHPGPVRSLGCRTREVQPVLAVPLFRNSQRSLPTTKRVSSKQLLLATLEQWPSSRSGTTLLFGNPQSHSFSTPSASWGWRAGGRAHNNGAPHTPCADTLAGNDHCGSYAFARSSWCRQALCVLKTVGPAGPVPRAVRRQRVPCGACNTPCHTSLERCNQGSGCG